MTANADEPIRIKIYNFHVRYYWFQRKAKSNYTLFTIFTLMYLKKFDKFMSKYKLPIYIIYIYISQATHYRQMKV